MSPVAALSLCLLAASVQLSSASGVLELTGATFHKTIDTNEASLVMFHAPWCPHCQDAKPKYLSAAKELSSSQGKVLAMVNCDDKACQELCSKQKIEGYPTFKFFSKGKFIQDYEDEPSEKAILEFMANPPKEGEKRQPAAAAGGAKEGEEESEPDTPMQDVTILGSNNYTEILDKHDFVLVFYYAPWCPHCKDSKPKYEAAAKELKAGGGSGSSIMAAMNCDIKDNQKLCEEEKVEGYPTIRLLKKRETWAEYEEEIETKPLLQFIRNPPKEKVPPTPVEEDKKADGSEKESAEKPEEKMKHVKYLEGDQFNAELQSKPYVLVMFYAPWCPHCVQSKPAYDKAAEKLIATGAADRELAAVNCDVKANEKICEDNKIEGFPTFYLFANGKKQQDYTEAPITADGVTQFMQKLAADGKKEGKDEL